MGLNTKDSYTRVKILCLPMDSQKDKTRKILVWDNFGNFYGFSFYVTIIILPGNDWQILNLFFFFALQTAVFLKLSIIPPGYYFGNAIQNLKNLNYVCQYKQCGLCSLFTSTLVS